MGRDRFPQRHRLREARRTAPERSKMFPEPDRQLARAFGDASSFRRGQRRDPAVPPRTGVAAPERCSTWSSAPSQTPRPAPPLQRRDACHPLRASPSVSVAAAMAEGTIRATPDAVRPAMATHDRSLERSKASPASTLQPGTLCDPPERRATQRAMTAASAISTAQHTIRRPDPDRCRSHTRTFGNVPWPDPGRAWSNAATFSRENVKQTGVPIDG